VAGALGTGIKVRDLFEYVLEQHPRCRCNPYLIFPSLEGALDKFLPANAASSLSGRVRTLLTRVSTKVPFITGEVVDQYRDWAEAWHTLRASCHVPGIFLLPYKMNGRFYFDGLQWSSFFVPWISTDSHTVRVSAICRPLTDMRAPLHPLWWTLFPPPPDVLRGLYWTGYRDAARWFSLLSQPHQGPLDMCRCRRSEEEADSPRRLEKFSTISKFILKSPVLPAATMQQDPELPVLDEVTGRNVADLIQMYHQSAERNLRVLGVILLTVTLSSVCATLW